MQDKQLEKARKIYDYAICIVIGITIGFLSAMIVMHLR